MPEWFEIKEKGAGNFRIKFLWAIYLILGPRIAKLLVLPVCLCMYPFLRDARASIKIYFEVLNSFERSRGLVCTKPKPFKLVYNYATSLLDKIASISGRIKRENVTFFEDENFKAFLNLRQRKEGFVIISSHLGNIEALGSCDNSRIGGSAPEVYIFVDSWAKSIYRRFFIAQQKMKNLHYIPVDSINLATFSKVENLLSRGAVFIIAGDRLSREAPDKFILADFLGRKCAFPKGAFMLATSFNCPVFFANCVSCGEVHKVYLKQSLAKTKRNTLDEYAAFLEECLLKAPYQWFNFFNFFAKK